MPRTLVRDLRKHLGQTVTVCGWVNSLRLQRMMQFVIVRDPSGMVQVTHRRGGEGDALEAVIESLTSNSAVRITGKVTGSEKLQGEGVVDQAAGKVQKTYGDVKEDAKDAVKGTPRRT